MRDKRGSGGDSQGPTALERVRAGPAVPRRRGGEARRGRRAVGSSGSARPVNGYLHAKRRARAKPFCARTRTRPSKRPCRRQAASPPSCAALLAQGKAASLCSTTQTVLFAATPNADKALQNPHIIRKRGRTGHAIKNTWQYAVNRAARILLLLRKNIQTYDWKLRRRRILLLSGNIFGCMQAEN